MFWYSIKYYIRSIFKRKLFTFINIAGLAFAISFMLLIGQFLYYEFSYNQDIEDVDNIYRLVNAEKDWGYMHDHRLKEEIIEKIPGVKNACLFNKFPTDVNSGSSIFKFDNMLIVDPNFFDIFKPVFARGNKTALNTIEGVVLTESSAYKILGDINVIGKSILLEHKDEMIVTGVIKDLPETMSFQADLLVNYENSIKKRITYTEHSVGDESSFPFNIFIQTEKGISIADMGGKISQLHKHNPDWYPEKAALVPLKTNYFDLDYKDYHLQHGNIKLLRILSIIGIIILILAIINFVNLTTAGYKYRLSEIGIKKCFGVNRTSIIKQLLIEALLVCILAATAGILFAELLLPYFNRFIEKPLHLQVFTDLNFFLLFISFVILLGISAGLLPAIILSKISPLHLLKSGPDLKGTGTAYRSILTTFQFTVSTILIFCLIVISRQIDYVKHKDLGFNTEQLLYMVIPYQMADKTKALADKLRQYHGTENLSLTMGIPGKINLKFGNRNVIAIDTATINTFGFKIIEGRELLPGDFQKACFINKAAQKELEESEIKEQKYLGFNIVGVVSDFHVFSLYNKNEPLALLYTDSWGLNYLTIRVRGQVKEAIDYINKTWEEICPDYSLNLQFYDELFASMYKKEENLAALLSLFTVLALVISCMGIFGLTVFQTQQKVKEIGIRKVFGAATYQIVFLLTKSFTRWVILANILAVPFAYYFMNEWLKDFAYRIDISFWFFIISGSIALIIALLTISFQAIKAATADPVESLKYE